MTTAWPSQPGHPQPGSTAALRDANVRRILDTVRTAQRTGSGLSQAQLARRTELSPATISGIVRALAAAGVVDVGPGSGRRGGQVRISRGAGLVTGISVGHSHVAVAVADLAGQILAQQRRPLAAEHLAREGLQAAAELLDSCLAEVGGQRAQIRQAGLGLPAPLMNGVVQSPGILPGWIGLNATAAAAEQLELPFVTDNDANLAALAELRRGTAHHDGSLIFVKVSSGVGAGVVLQGQLQRGATGMAGELGHVTVDEAGPYCRCGNRGCLEAYVSVPFVLSALEAALPGATFPEVIEQARQGHPPAARALDDVGTHLGQVLSVAVNLLQPAAIVVGGEMSAAGDLVLQPLRAALRRHCLDTVAGETQVIATELGEDATLIGAVEAALDEADIVDVLDR